LNAFVLDNSVTMRWCFENTATSYSDNVLRQMASSEATVPILWFYEVSAVLAKSQKNGSIAAVKADAFLTTPKSINITVDRDGPDRTLTDVYHLAIKYGLTSYDAAYLELAIRKKLPLATLDVVLSNACVAAGEMILPER
jgi:predicted nucleic acid-binding protein